MMPTNDHSCLILAETDVAWGHIVEAMRTSFRNVLLLKQERGETMREWYLRALSIDSRSSATRIIYIGAAQSPRPGTWRYRAMLLAISKLPAGGSFESVRTPISDEMKLLAERRDVSAKPYVATIAA